MLFDTHTHLCDERFEPDREEVLKRAVESRIQHIVEVADAPQDWEKVIALSRVRPQVVRCSLGLHPYYSDTWSEGMEHTLSAKAALPEVTAIGEIGLDYVHTKIPAQTQQKTLLKMLALALNCGKPVILHCREAYPDMLGLLEKFYADHPKKSRFRGVLHCFSGTQEHASAAVKLGFALGVDGPVTYPKNDALRQSFLKIGLDSLVLETDSPYLPPQSSRGKRNEPALLADIAQAVAKLFSLPLEEVAKKTTGNALSLFNISDQLRIR